MLMPSDKIITNSWHCALGSCCSYKWLVTVHACMIDFLLLLETNQNISKEAVHHLDWNTALSICAYIHLFTVRLPNTYLQRHRQNHSSIIRIIYPDLPNRHIFPHKSKSLRFFDWLIDDHLYSAILHSLEQTHCARMWFYMSNWLFSL